MARRLFPGLRGLMTPTPRPALEGKVVYTGAQQILAAAAAGAISSNRAAAEVWDIERAINDAFTKVVWVYKAVSTIAENSSRLPFILHDKDDDEVDDHPLYHVLNDGMANPLETGRMFRERLSMQILLSPRGAFVEVSRNALGEPVRVDLLPPGRTRPMPASGPNAGKDLISHFEVLPANGMGDPRKLKIEDVRWFRKPHPTDPFAGLTPLEAAGQSVLLDYFTRLYNLSFMRNDGRPGGILGVEGDMEESDMDRLEARFGRGPVEAGKLSVVSGEVSYVDTATTPRDSQYQTASLNAKNEILVAFGVPESQIGNASGSTFANAEEDGLAFWNSTMRTHNHMIASGFTPDVEDDSLTPTLDTSDVEVLQLAARRAREEARTEFGLGLRSILSYARLADIDIEDTALTRAHWIASGKQVIPYSDDEKDKVILPTGAEEPAAAAPGAPGATPGALPGGTSSSVVPDGDVGETKPPGAGTTTSAVPGPGAPRGGAVSAASGTPSVMPLGTSTARTSVATSPNNGTEGKVLRLAYKADPSTVESESPGELLDGTEVAVQGALEAVAARQSEVVAARVVSPKARKGTRHWRAQDGGDTRAGSGRLDAVKVVDAARWEREVETAVTPIVERAATAAATGLLDDLGITEDPEEKAATTGPPKRRVLSAATRAAIAASVAESLWVAKNAIRGHSASLAQRITEVEESGADLDTIVVAVRDYAEQYRRGWSNVVALQVSQAAIEGSRVRVGDLSRKQRDIQRIWRSRHDSHVRDSHVRADGQQQRLGQPFKVGGVLVRWPGDPLAPPAEAMNCRCRVVFLSRTARRVIAAPRGEIARQTRRPLATKTIDALLETKRATPDESNLVAYARRELARLGMVEGADGPDGWMAENVLSVIRSFSEGGHSGGSASYATSLLDRLLRFKPLSPLTSSPDEWMLVGGPTSDHPDMDEVWQGLRDPEAFSSDGGRTYTLLSTGDRVYTAKDPATPVAVKTLGWVPLTVKHLPGRHNQLTHAGPDIPRIGGGVLTRRRPRIGVNVGISARQKTNRDAWLAERGVTREQIRQNVLNVFDRASPAARTEGLSWYPDAHAEADRLGRTYGVPTEQAAAVIAALSPRTNWDLNKVQAGRVLDAINTPMDVRIEPDRAERADRLFKTNLARVEGTTVNTADLSPVERIAVYPGLYGLPDGLIKGARVASGEDPDDVLGGSKVRSFFNNMNDPTDAHSVTIDTHMVRAAFDSIELSDKDYEAIAVAPAKYEWFAEVIREAAEERGILPQQMQAVTWVQWRNEHPLLDRRAATARAARAEGKALDVHAGSTFSGEALSQAEFDALVAEVTALKDDIAADTARILALKHLPTQHVQKTHGNRVGKPSVIRRPKARNVLRKATPELIAALNKRDIRPKIPPGWSDIQVVDYDSSDGLVAIGKDSKGRQQRSYRVDYLEANAVEKYKRGKVVATKMRRLDTRLTKDLKSPDQQTRRTAAAVLIMRRTGMRVGSERDRGGDAEAYGATTLQARHVQVTAAGTVIFDFPAKKGHHTHLVIKGDKQLHDAVVAAKGDKQRRESLFPDVSERDTIEYLREATGIPMKNHDLRTHLANVIAAQEIAKRKVKPNAARYKKWRNEIGDIVAAQLGNTRTMALNSYIDPRVWDEWAEAAGVAA